MERQRTEQFIALDNDNDEELIKPYAIKRNQNGDISFVQWNDMLIREEVLKGIKDAGFTFPSQIQYRAIPQIVKDQRRDVICQARSGTGKTAVFILSLLSMLTPEQNGEYLPHSCIVVANTRELAHQIFLDFRKLSTGFLHPPLRISCYFGGISYNDAKQELKSSTSTPHIIIGALGRLRHLMMDKLICTANVKHFVVDQCDSILNKHNNLEDLRYLLLNTSNKKQLLMFTATLTEITRKLCLAMMRKTTPPFVLEIDAKKVNLKTLRHFGIIMPESLKFQKLLTLLDSMPFNQCIIFVNKVDKSLNLTEMLKYQLFNPICINSNLPQQRRLENYDMFKNNGCRIMVATDVFGRGIDIEKANLIINYDFPFQTTTYMHRAARAGRFGKKGVVINFIKPANHDDQQFNDQTVFKEIVQQYQVRIQEIQAIIQPTDLF